MDNEKRMLKKARNVVASAFRAKGYYTDDKLIYFKVLEGGGETFKYYYRGKIIVKLIISLKDYLNDESGYVVKNLFTNPRTLELVQNEMTPNTNENLIGFDRDIIYARLEQEEPKPEPVKILEVENEVAVPEFSPKKFDATATKKKSYEPMSVRRQMKQRSFGPNDPYDLLLESMSRQISVM